jgi:VacB/RNase II family 3'-5' exoribonuclease
MTVTSHRARLRTIAFEAMRARGLDPEFPADALAEVAALSTAPQSTTEPVRDLRSLPWCSIDNDDSRDLDQLSVMDVAANGSRKVLIAIADVDAAVQKGLPVDRHAAVNTTSVYTPAMIFPMLPERLSTDLSSLGEGDDRLAVVVELTMSSQDDLLTHGDVYGAIVRNRAKLTYNGVDAWLTGTRPLPAAAAAVTGMDEQLRLQDRAAQALGRARHELGALAFESVDVQFVFEGDHVREIRGRAANRAKALIENFMIAANGVVARFLDARGFPSIRRVVRSPERWDRLRALAARYGDELPATADSKALAGFLARRQAAAPAEFADLSHSVIRLLGSGEYVVDPPGQEPPGHFGLAVRDYTHSTAPNRRYPDLITQRLVKAALARRPSPYTIAELEELASHCTRQEDAASKVERQVRKSAAALVIASRVGERFDAVVTGASPKGTFVRVTMPPIEGKVVKGERGLDVGDRVRVQLVAVDVDRGFIDFVIHA